MNFNFRAVLLMLACVLTAFPAWAEKPNVLFISVDDLNDFTGYAGHPEVITPNMDRLAARGTWFSRAYCQYPVCGPSRASLMTGLYYHQLDSPKLQVKDSYAKEKAESIGSKLLHDYMKGHGYKTMAVGKILHRHLPKESLDMSGGRGPWDHNRGPDGKQVESNWKTSTTLTDWGVYNGEEHEMSDSKAAKWAVARLEETHDKPFMLMVGFLRPHVPWHVPQKYFDMYDRSALTTPPYRVDDLDDVPPAAREVLNKTYPRTEWDKEANQWQHILQSYYASVTFADTKVGEVLDALDASPYRDNTIVVLWSDHGYHLGEKNTFQKHTLWERSARAPMIISLPKSMEAQQSRGETQRVVGLIDLYPTLLDLCGLPPNDKVEGRSLKPLLMDREAQWDYPTLTYRKNGGKTIRDEHYRYIEYGDGSCELYDVLADPNEWTNLAPLPEHAEAVKAMQAKLAKHHVE